MMSAKELAVKAKAAKPEVRYAYSTNDTSVAAWSNEHWTIVAGRILTGGFASIPVELLVNGIRFGADLDFVEV